MSDPEIERAALALFEAYLERPESERHAWLEVQTAGQPALRARFDAIARADRQSVLMTGGASAALQQGERPERIGAYAIIGTIGSGGMGTVYHGARDSGDFTHDVAIKLIKPGVLSERLIERFRGERQTLAQLRHPNIAQLYDGGESADGSPYIVMELIEGQPLLEWAGTQQLSDVERAMLLATVARAIGFAHRSLVVHRDITPSNILVTAGGSPKLIDFGIARPVAQGEPPDDAPPASIDSLSLTPGFAAPERMKSAAVTTAADIYSLGKVLAALVPGQDADLRAIVARATATDPADRYSTADALADDLDAWRTGHPVAARGGGWRYRARRFFGRNRALSAVAAAALIGLLAAFALTVAAYQRAESARSAEAARFAELRSLANYMLFDLNARLARVTGNIDARVDLANRAQAYLSALAESPQADPALKQEVARGFTALALAQGVPTQPNLGETERARANLARAVGMLERLPAGSATADLAEARVAYAMIQAHKDAKIADAGRTIAAAAAALAAMPVNGRDARWYRAQRRLRLGQLEMTTLGQRPDEMLKLADGLERDIASWPAAMRDGREARIDRAYADYYRGLHDYFSDQLVSALASLHASETAFAAIDAALPNDPAVLFAQMWASYVGFGAASGVPGRTAEADAFLQRAIRTSDRILAIEPHDNGLRSFAGNLRQAQSQALSERGDPAGAIAIQREVIALYRAGLGRDRAAIALNRLATAQVVMANIARKAGDRAIACENYRDALAAVTELARRNAVLGTVAANRAALARNVAGCARGDALSRMSVLE